MKSKGEKKKKTIEVKERVIIEVGGKKHIVESNTPTVSFYNHLYGELTAETPVAVLGYIRYIGLYDTDLREVCLIEVTPERSGFASVRATGSCTWTSDKPGDRIVIYNQDKVSYSAVPFPPDVTPAPGSPVTVTWEAEFGVSSVGATGWLAGASIHPAGFADQLVNILINNRGDLLLTAVRTVVKGRSGTNYDATFIDTELTRDPHEFRIIMLPTAVGISGEVTRVVIYSRTATGEDRELLTLTLSTPLAVSAGDSLAYEIQLVR